MIPVPKVTIITPSYCHRRYLPDRVESILRQTLTDWEWIIIDDCSRDGSVEYLVERTQDNPAIKLIVHQENQGQDRTINEGMALARGEFIHIAESDDICDPALLERLARVLDENPKVGLSHARLRFIDSEGRVFSDWPNFRYPSPLRELLLTDHIISGIEAYRLLMVYGNFLENCSGALFRRECYEQLGGRNPAYLQLADMDMWLRIAAKWDVGYVAEPMVGFRWHPRTTRAEQKAAPHIVAEWYAAADRALKYVSLSEVEEAALRRICYKRVGRTATAIAVRYNLQRGRGREALEVYHRASAYDPYFFIRPSFIMTVLIPEWLWPILTRAAKRLLPGWNGRTATLRDRSRQLDGSEPCRGLEFK